MDSAKRRKIFFSTRERNILIDLVEARKQIIECKHSDYSTTEKKHRAWEDVAVDFNAQTGVTARNSKQLKKCWENTKAKAKKELADIRKETMGSMRSGGAELHKPSDDCLRVMAINHYRYQLDDEYEETRMKSLPASESLCIAELHDCDHCDDVDAPTNPSSELFDNNYDSTPGKCPAIANTHLGNVTRLGHSSSSSSSDQASSATPIQDDSFIGKVKDDRPQSQPKRGLYSPAVVTAAFGVAEREHYMALQLIQEKRALQFEKHKCEMNLLKLRLGHEKRIFKLKQENELRHRKILEVQELFWNSNLRNLVSDGDKID